MVRWTLALVAGLLVMVTACGWDRPADGAQPGTSPAARAVSALTADAPDAQAQLPADYATVMGYSPVVGAAGALSRSDGSCSSPFGDTTYGFGAGCRQHDLGYDLLRYAARTGTPLGPWARHAIDTRFARDTRARCTTHAGPGCRLTAELYVDAVTFNSWRQGYGTPVVEHLPAVLPGMLAGVLTALALGFAGPRRRPPTSPSALRDRIDAVLAPPLGGAA